MQTIQLLLALLLTTQVLGGKKTDCTKHTNLGARTKCVGSLYEDGLISEKEFGRDLGGIIQSTPSDNTYYSIGLQTGSQPGLVVAKQTHPLYSASYMLPLSYEGWGITEYDRINVPSIHAGESVLFYQVHDTHGDYLTIGKNDPMSDGDGLTHNLYFAQGWNLDTTTKECIDVNTIPGHNFAMKHKNVVLIVPRANYCAGVHGPYKLKKTELTNGVITHIIDQDF